MEGINDIGFARENPSPTAEDIIELKKAGITDEVIQAIIQVVGESADSQRQQAYDLLKKMEIRVDLRDGD